MKWAVAAAMEAELKQLVDRLKNQEKIHQKGCYFYTGSLEGCQTVLLLTGIGKVNTAVSVTQLLRDFSPDAVINTGVAGGFDPSLNIGDIVLSSEVRHHDVDVCSFGYEPGQVPRMPGAFAADPNLLKNGQRAAEKLPDIQVKTGLIVSGDIFIHQESEARRIRSAFPNTVAADMEAAALAQVCHIFETPFLIARSISDIIVAEKDENKDNTSEHENFLELAVDRSVRFVTQFFQTTGDF